MSDVFISYSRKNSDFVHKLDDALRKLQRDVWTDWQDIARGEDWWRSIQTGIDSADTALIIVTEHWLLSEICHRELDYIRQQNKRVFPIIRERIEGDLAIRVKGTWVDQEWEQRARDNWKYIRSLNWIYFDDDTTFESVLNDLITALDTDQLYVKSHTRYLVRALEWQQFKRNPSFLLEGDQLASAKEWLDSSANKHPEPHPAHHEYITAGKVAEAARQARDKAREQLIRRFRQMAVILGVLVVIAIIAAVVVGQQFLTARAEVTKAGATLQQVNLQVTDAIQQQAAAVAQANAARDLVATATVEQGQAVVAQRTSFARENIASTKVAIANATLAPVPVTLTAVAVDIADVVTQQNITNEISNASLSLTAQDNAGAIQIVDQLIQDYPDEATAFIGRGVILETVGKIPEAIESFQKAIEMDTQGDYSSYAYSGLGRIYLNSNEFDKAIESLKHAIEEDENNVEAYMNLGFAYFTQKDYAQAVQAFSSAIDVDPSSDAYNARGQSHYYNQDIEAALVDYNQAIELNPQSSYPYYNRATLYREQDNPDAALADYTKAIELSPDDGAIYYDRATLYLQQGKLKQASDDFWMYTQLTDTAFNDTNIVNAGDVPVKMPFDMTKGMQYDIPFEAAAGQQLVASAVSPDHQVDTLLIVLDPNNNPVTSNDNQSDSSTDSTITDYVIPKDGYYTLVVSRALNSGEGKVNVTLDLKNPASPLTPTPTPNS